MIKQERKQRKEQLSIALNGYAHRIKEQRATIKECNNNIKRFKLLKKQARNTYRIEVL